MFLLDTDVVSAIAPGRGRSNPELEGWTRAHHAVLFISAITIAELEAGVSKLMRTGATQKAASIARWIDATIVLFGDRILAFDVAAARAAGALHDKVRASGVEPGFADAAIAATAAVHGFTLLTRNVRHFAPFGVPMQNPFATLPGS